MNSTLSKARTPKYPCLKEFKGQGNGVFIVLFSARGEGMVVHTNNKMMDIGYTSDEWIETDFELFSGSITLSN